MEGVSQNHLDAVDAVTEKVKQLLKLSLESYETVYNLSSRHDRKTTEQYDLIVSITKEHIEGMDMFPVLVKALLGLVDKLEAELGMDDED